MAGRAGGARLSRRPVLPVPDLRQAGGHSPCEPVETGAGIRVQGQGYFPRGRPALAWGRQFPRQKGPGQNPVGQRSVAAPADPGYGQWKSGHCRRIPPAVRGLFL